MREIRVHSQESRYRHTCVGVLGNRMDTLRCAIDLVKRERFEWKIEQHRQILARYNALLSELPAGMDVVAQRPDRTSVLTPYTLISSTLATRSRRL